MRNAFMLRFAAASVIALSAVAHAGEIGDAAKAAFRADKALAKKKLPAAISEAESAVAASPRDANYRMLLGRAYLESGRFRSAAASFGDALELDPSRSGAALNLALTRIGMGDKNGAMTVLSEHGSAIPASDRGLALALAGDATTGVTVLEEAVRNGGSDAKTRQNLALAYALAGRWSESKLMASYDLDPQTVAQRIMEWSRFARDGQASAQVAALLGVTQGDDAGQPTRLALHSEPNAPVQMAEAAPPPPPVKMTEAPAVETVAAEVQALVNPPAQPAVQFQTRSEVVQAIAGPVRPTIAVKPAMALKPHPAVFQRAAFVRPTGGRFVVQIGAYSSAGVAQDGWTKAVRRIGDLRGYTPSTAVFVKGSATFYRLSVGGFGTRGSAVSFCETLRSRGGQCFVRETAGDAPLQWAGRSGPKFAAR
ncbi:SPOR domain-containing protein [Sphingomonas tabacisoli]|uniref:SPOR domain-containing protein n=1 Tax=Sphingomonas tabacisoli TaxID=2249466 RepID=A0ABW4I490_9SPHN